MFPCLTTLTYLSSSFMFEQANKLLERPVPVLPIAFFSPRELTLMNCQIPYFEEEWLMTLIRSLGERFVKEKANFPSWPISIVAIRPAKSVAETENTGRQVIPARYDGVERLTLEEFYMTPGSTVTSLEYESTDGISSISSQESHISPEGDGNSEENESSI
jgi:hypothetical protein